MGQYENDIFGLKRSESPALLCALELRKQHQTFTMFGASLLCGASALDYFMSWPLTPWSLLVPDNASITLTYFR
jgi:hypothetical protein